TTINLTDAKNVGEINAASSDVVIANSTLNGSTSVKSLNLSGTISAANDILAVNDITINKADLNLQGGLRSSNSNISFNDSKGSIKGDIEANKVSFVSGSNLNTITANDIKAKEIEFNLPNSVKYNNVALQLTTTGNTDLSSTKIKAFLSDASNLKGNGAIHLIQTAGKLTAPSTTDVSGVAVNVAGLINVAANIELDSTGKNLDLSFNGTPSGSGGGGTGGATANEGAKTLLETKLSQNTVVNEGVNLFVSNLEDIANSANNANSALSANGANSTNSNLDLGKAVAFAFVSGYDKEMTTGSHIDIKGFNANAGIAGNDYFSSGNLTTGLFVEYGKGEYDSFLDDGTKGSGKTEFIGGGAFARFTTLNNFYTEVSGRVGQVKTEYETTAAYKGFDISNTYYGAHLGLGKIFELTSSNDLDIFARGIWAKTAGNDLVLNGINTHFDSVTSLRAQVGLKDNIKFSDTSKLYVGASYQYEFDGEAKGTLIVPAINAVADIASPKLKGSTGIGEIGYVYENSSIKFEAGAKGYVGKEKGYSGNLGVTIKF
ncbi:MAG: autotransporter outer membrane beta-barrel domain-containing protein, partial [Campylobacter sp.]|nr:autotransporter outer membrane beta-barrel domain-containing protein [Campylobacter sp.]